MRKAAIEGRIEELERQISQERKKLTALNEVYSRSHFKEEDGKMVRLTLILNDYGKETFPECKDGRKAYEGRLSVKRGGADPLSGVFSPGLLGNAGKIIYYPHSCYWKELEIEVIGD